MLKLTPKKRVLFVRRLTPVLLAIFGVFSFALTFVHSPKLAYAAASSTINFQARLQTRAGGIVPDGDYNVTFKLYNASTSGTSTDTSCSGDSNCLWVESRTGSNKVHVTNGYLSVQLGSVTPFGAGIDWTQNLWLTMNIGGTSTPAWDGEMDPRLPLTAVPYAFTAGQLQNTSGSNTSTLSIQAPTGGNQTFVIQDQGAAGTYDLLTQNEADSSYVKLSGGSPQNGDINISGTATSDSVVTNSIDTTSAGPLAIGGTNASTISIGSSGGNTTTTINGSAVVKSTSGNDSTTALQVQNSGGGTAVFDVDTANNRVGININEPTRTLDINTTDDTGSAPPVLINQQGTGDADIELKTPNQSFYMGVDNSDNSTFKISSSAANGTLFTMGLTTQGANLDTGSGGYIICQPMTPDTSGMVTGVSVEYGPPLDSVNNKFRLALFGDTLGLPSATPIAESGEGTISTGWNNIGLSASVTAGTQYWLCVQSNTTDNTKNNLYYNTGAANNVKFLPQTYPSWPTSGWSNGGAVNFSLYATIAPASAGDSFAASLFSLTNTGAATFQNSVNSTTALQVQNASGTNTVLNVDTTNGRIGIDTSAPTADLTFGGGAARTIAIATAPADSDGSQLTIQAGNGNGTNKNGGNLLLQAGNSTGTGTAGSVIVRSQTNAVNAFQVQSATTQTLLNVDTTNALAVSLGSDSSVVGTTTVGGTPNSGGQNGIITRRITTSAAGTLNGITFYVNGVDTAPGNTDSNFQVAIYSDSSTCAASAASCPGTLIASSTAGTLNGFAWNTRPLSASLAAGTNYWIAIEQNAGSSSLSNTVYTSATGDHYSFYQGSTACTGGTVGYGVWPTTLGSSCTPISNNISTINLSAYATINTGSDGYAISTDNNAHVGIGTAANSTDMVAINGVATNSALNVTGYATISSDSKRAFAIQNAAGSVTDFEVDTNNQKVYVNSSFGGTNAASFNIHGAGASSIDMLDIYNNSNIAVLQVNKDGTTTFGSSSARAGIGTVTNAANSATVTAGATATLFTSQLKVGDTLTLDPSGTPATCVVLSIASDTSLTCTSNIASAHSSPGVAFNFTGAGSSDITSVQANGNIKFGSGNAHNIYVDTAISGNNGDNLTIQAGSGNGTNKNGGNLVLQGGNSTGTGTAGSVVVKSQANSATAFQVQNSSSATIFTVDTTTSEKVTIGPSGGDTTGAILVLGIKTNSGDPTTEVDGAMYYNSNMGSFRCGQGGVWQSCIGGLLTSTTQINNTVTATASETALGTTYSLPANYCANGRTLRLTMYGTYQTAANATLAIRTKIGGNTVATNYAADTFVTHNQDSGWSYTGVIICPNAAGSNATVSAQGLLTFGGDVNRAIPYTITNSVNTSSSNALSISAQWNTNDAANIFTLRTFMLESLGP